MSFLILYINNLYWLKLFVYIRFDVIGIEYLVCYCDSFRDDLYEIMVLFLYYSYIYVNDLRYGK